MKDELVRPEKLNETRESLVTAIMELEIIDFTKLWKMYFSVVEVNLPFTLLCIKVFRS